MKIKIIKFNENVKLPTRAHYDDAGLDCYAMEDFTIKHLLNENPITTINLGFGLEIPNGYMGTIRPRSSFNNKGIITYIGTIDSGYRGEIKVNFTSLNGDFHIKKGDRICQLVIEPIAIVDLVENLGNERGKGGFGSTGE